jgi:hypothetical protein
MQCAVEDRGFWDGDVVGFKWYDVGQTHIVTSKCPSPEPCGCACTDNKMLTRAPPPLARTFQIPRSATATRVVLRAGARGGHSRTQKWFRGVR